MEIANTLSRYPVIPAVYPPELDPARLDGRHTIGQWDSTSGQILVNVRSEEFLRSAKLLQGGYKDVAFYPLLALVCHEEAHSEVLGHGKRFTEAYRKILIERMIEHGIPGGRLREIAYLYDSNKPRRSWAFCKLCKRFTAVNTNWQTFTCKFCNMRKNVSTGMASRPQTGGGCGGCLWVLIIILASILLLWVLTLYSPP